MAAKGSVSKQQRKLRRRKTAARAGARAAVISYRQSSAMAKEMAWLSEIAW